MKFTQQLPPSIYSESTLKKNLDALLLKNKRLFERICWPVDSSHILFDEKLDPVFRIQTRHRPLALSGEVCAGALSPFAESKIVLIMGIGNSELIDMALTLCAHAKIFIWDRDPWLLRLSLMRRDYTEFIRSGRLSFLLGIDLVRTLKALEKADKILHPLFDDIYQNEWILLRDGLQKKRALLCAGHLFVADVADALRGAGYSVFSLDNSLLSLEEIDNIFNEYKPDIVFCINYIQNLSELCERHNKPFLCWEIDPSIDSVEYHQTDPGRSFIFTYRKENIDLFFRAGFINVYYHPLGANPQRRFPVFLRDDEKEKYTGGVSFVGASMVYQSQVLFARFLTLCSAFGLDARQCVDRANRILDEQRRDFSGFCIPALLKEYFPELYADSLKLQSFRVNPVMLLGEIAASEKRLFYLKALEGFSVSLWGDAGWQRIAGNGAVYRGEAGHRFELNKIYSASLINVDINRLYQTDIVTMRVFDVLACGGFVLTEHSDSLNELFRVGDELETYGSVDEMRAKVGYYLSHPASARQIAQRGMERVLRDHTIEQRVQKMLEIVSGINKS